MGADPEFFLKRGDEFYPSCGIIGGTKEKPLPLTESGIPGLSVQEDNVAVEITTAPWDNRKGFVTALTNSVDYLPMIFPEELDLSLSEDCSAYFDPKYLTSEQAQEFGCDPDVNAYTGRLNEISEESKVSNFRTCGGHVHIGFVGELGKLEVRRFVRALDLYLGVPSLFLDKDTERRKLYGAAGAFRYKDYGIEYRTLSNFWMFSPNLIGWVWDAVHLAADKFNMDQSGEFMSADTVDYRKVRMAINRHDLDLAQVIVEDYNLVISKEKLVNLK